MSYLRAIGEALFRPWATTSAGSLWTHNGALPYPAPCQLYDYILIVRMGYMAHPLFGYNVRPRIDMPHVVDALPVQSGAMLVLAVSYPMMFLALPITRRRARVRAVHFMRVTAYSFVMLIASLQTAGIILLACWYSPNNSDALFDSMRRVQGFGLPVLLLIWWYCAIRLHLRLPNALAVTLILAILNVLVVVGAAFLMGSALFGL